MNLILTNSSKNLDEDDFEYLNNKLGINLPSDLKDIYTSWNGGEVENERVVFISELNNHEYALDSFLPIRYKRYDGDLTMDEEYMYYTNKEFIPSELLPFAIDGGGFPFCYNLNTGNILFCNMEHYSQDFSHLEIICYSLNGVISNLMTREEAYG